MNHVLFLYTCVALILGAVLGRFGAARTVRRLRTQLTAVEHRASHDLLTGLLNRGGLHEQFTVTDQQPRLLILVDLDGFKTVNDRFGHATGDVLLTRFASRLATAATRHDGIAGRLGGDEFLLLLHRPDPADALAVDRLVAALCAPTPVPGARTAQGLSASAGITTVAPGLSWSVALRQADIALYHAKASPHSVARYRPDMTHPARPGDTTPSGRLHSSNCDRGSTFGKAPTCDPHG